ncbi:Symplekin [Astathelohania contejeani]|uniref:Symplekin n=1 Tax=Astathelohania contejeani TaxID=164912 RepID=A0ABQ7HZH6_9MICR|nr:Symplekin [Thelohania contejeani]
MSKRIKNAFINNNQAEIVDILKATRSLQPNELIYMLSLLVHANLPPQILLPYLLELQARPLSLPAPFQRAFLYHIGVLTQYLRQNKIPPPSSLPFFTGIRLHSKKSHSTGHFSLSVALIEQIMEAFIGTPTRELENAIEHYLNPTSRPPPRSMLDEILGSLCHISRQEKPQVLRYLLAILETESYDPQVILSTMRQEDLLSEFFLLLYLRHPLMHKQFMQNVPKVEYYKYFVDLEETVNELLEIKPESEQINNIEEKTEANQNINESKYYIESYIIEFVRYILSNRPKYNQRAIEYIITEKEKIKKEDLMSIILDHPRHFLPRICDFDLTLDELIQIAEERMREERRNDGANTTEELIHHIYEIMMGLELQSYHTHFNKLLEFIENMSESSLKRFIIKFADSDNFVLILKALVKIKKLDSGIITYLIDPGSKNGYTNFSILKYYLGKDLILKYIEYYIVNQESINDFLEVITPSEVFYKSHYLNDIDKSIKITGLCLARKDIFDEKVVWKVIIMMEDSIPPLFMRTVILALIAYPGLKKSIIKLMFRLVKIRIWCYKGLYEGFIKCLSILGKDGVDIIFTLPKDKIIGIVEENEKIRKEILEYSKRHNIKRRYKEILKLIREKI